MLSILLCFAVQFSAIGISTSNRRSFFGAVYAASGVAVSGAVVTASGPQGYGYATTDSSGHFSINKGLNTGSYAVIVVKDGYVNGKIDNVYVTAGHETPNNNVYLNLSGVISGKVTESGTGISLQNIALVAFSGGGSQVGAAVTDSSGNYRIASNLATGTYNVSAFLPEAHATNSVGNVLVTAGAETTNVNLVLERSGAISGTITVASNGAPLANATITAFSSVGGYFGYAQTDVTGHYKISSGLGSGTYTVTAIYMSGTVYGYNYTGGVIVTLGSETSGVDMELDVTPPPASGAIRGKVTDQSSKTVVGASVTAQGPAGDGEATTDQNGNYDIGRGLGTGTYTVTVTAAGYMTQNRTGVSVTAGAVTASIDFQLSQIPSAQSGTISGTVTGEANPIPEFPFPLAVGLITTAVAVVLVKTLRPRRIS
jgi:hypothetical protein